MDFSHCSVSEISAIVSPPLRFNPNPVSKSFSFNAKLSPAAFPISLTHHRFILPVVLATSGGDHGSIPPTGGGGGGGGSNNGKNDDNDEDRDDESESGEEEEEIAQKGEEITANKNKEEAMKVLAEEGRALESLPADLASAIEEGRMPGSVVKKFFELESSGWLFKWLMQFGGFKERLLADDLFLAKLAMECGVGIFTKAAAEYERRREHFFKELDFVIADVVMAIIADFMLVYLPAPTVSLKPALAVNAGALAKFFHNCPENAFQKALAGTSYTLLQRLGAVVRNGAKLFAVGTTSSLVGTSVTNILIKARKQLESKGVAEEEKAEDLPIVSTSLAYGLYMSVSSNMRYQILAGVIEQRMLEPIFHNQKVILSALCFAVRTGNTFLGSLLWVDYARWIGVQ